MAEKKYRIGVDLGGTNIKVGVIDSQCTIVGKKSTKTKANRPWKEVVKDIADTTTKLLQELAINIDECEKIGIGSPGMIDHVNGVVVFAGNFNWEQVPLLDELGRYFSLPLRLSNDANCAAYGEVIAGAAKGSRHVVLLTLGTGVGGGVVCNRQLEEGGAPGALELGHTLLVMDGEPCSCGRKGCLEAYASASALKRQAQKAAEENPASLLNIMCKGDLSAMNGAIPFKAARQGDAVAQKVVDFYIQCLGEGIINFINIWRPEKVLLGGGISNEGDPLIVPLNAYVKPRCFAGEQGQVAPIEVAALGNDAGLIGAASL